MSSINLVASGLVYRNPRPAVRSRQAYFPTLVELPSGELLVGMDIGSAFESLDVRSYACRSEDGGKTWTEPTKIFEPDETHHRVSTSCRLGRVDDNSIMGWICLFDRSREEEGLGNPVTEGFCHTDFVSVKSTDGGYNWTTPQHVELPTDWRHFETCAPPFCANELGRLILVTSAWPNWEGKSSPWQQNGLAFVSEDCGATWKDIIAVFPSSDSKPLMGLEQALTRLSDGRLLAVCWTCDRLAGKTLHNRWCLSDDGGRHFDPPQYAPILGETCRPLGLENNRVLFVYRRVDKPGLWAHLAVIEDNVWRPLEDIPLWNGLTRDEPSEGHSKLEDMSQLKFGCPAVIRRKDGDVFVVFWCIEDCVSVIRWLRIEVS